MHDGSILVAGVGGLGCLWARRAHDNCSDYADLLLVDADERSFEDARHAHCLPLGDTSSEGCAALPELAESHMRRAKPLTEQMLAPVELLLLLTGLGGGAGTGASHALAAQAKQNGALVLSVAATPFEDQPARCDLAEGALPRLEEASDVCVRLSLDRLAWQARERGSDWRRDASWVEELVQGIVLTLGRVGLINLDLMDLRAVVGHTGEATLLVAEGDATDPEALFRSALASPLAGLQVEGASGCLLQIEGGRRMTVAQVNSVADAFTRGFSDDSQVILGARMADELDGRMRVVAVVSGL